MNFVLFLAMSSNLTKDQKENDGDLGIIDKSKLSGHWLISCFILNVILVWICLIVFSTVFEIGLPSKHQVTSKFSFSKRKINYLQPQECSGVQQPLGVFKLQIIVLPNFMILIDKFFSILEISSDSTKGQNNTDADIGSDDRGEYTSIASHPCYFSTFLLLFVENQKKCSFLLLFAYICYFFATFH